MAVAVKRHEISVVLVDDHPMVFPGLRHALKDAPEVSIVAEVDSGERAVTVVREKKPDVAVLDVLMPSGVSGLDTARVLLKLESSPAVMGMSHGVPGHVIRKFLSVGASGFVLQESVMDQLVSAIRAVAGGDRFLCKRSESLVEAAEAKWKSLGYDKLTAREREVFDAYAAGLDRGSLADYKKIKLATVNVHMAHIEQKLGVSNPVKLALDAQSVGLGLL